MVASGLVRKLEVERAGEDGGEREQERSGDFCSAAAANHVHAPPAAFVLTLSSIRCHACARRTARPRLTCMHEPVLSRASFFPPHSCTFLHPHLWLARRFPYSLRPPPLAATYLRSSSSQRPRSRLGRSFKFAQFRPASESAPALTPPMGTGQRYGWIHSTSPPASRRANFMQGDPERR
jgi:hypothetical protein